MVGFDLDPLILRLADEFKRRAMQKHLSALRRFYRARRSAKDARLREAPSAWDEDMVIGWLGLLRIAPFDHVYPVRPHGASCACGARKEGASSYVACVFPGGQLWHCAACGARWLVLEQSEPPR